MGRRPFSLYFMLLLLLLLLLPSPGGPRWTGKVAVVGDEEVMGLLRLSSFSFYQVTFHTLHRDSCLGFGEQFYSIYTAIFIFRDPLDGTQIDTT